MDTEAPALVLIVDDNAADRYTLTRYLCDDFRVVALASARDVRSYLEKYPAPAVILLDLFMPIEDGWSLCRSLRTDPRTAGIPILVTSLLPEAPRHARTLEVDGYLRKSHPPEFVREVVSSFCRAPQ